MEVAGYGKGKTLYEGRAAYVRKLAHGRKVSVVGESMEKSIALFLRNVRGDDRMDAYHAVQNGFPLRSVVVWVDNSPAFKKANVLSKIIGSSDRTLARRMQEPDRLLTPEQSTRALYFAEIMEKATEVLGSRDLAEQWMSEPARGLDGLAPVDLIANAIGYELVNDFLTRMDYGVY
ncbi:DUF2384 domain-containing protein [Pseudomonas sp. C1C7]|nr:DUF2384 domain-containing protein [Pseudomonas sp. C1C7]